jgi:hypothetical protein
MDRFDCMHFTIKHNKGDYLISLTQLSLNLFRQIFIIILLYVAIACIRHNLDKSSNLKSGPHFLSPQRWYITSPIHLSE